MKRDIIGDIFLGGVLLSLLFLFTFPAYFCFSQNAPRDISLTERLMSVFFVMAFILTCIWVCWKKKIWVMLGLSFFAVLPYIPKWFLPKVNMRIILNGRSLLDSILSMILNRIYELTHAPFTGLIGMFSEKTVEKLPYKMLPLVIFSYIFSQIVRFYYNAYVTEKKQIHDFNHFRKANDIRKPTLASLEEEPAPAPAPLGTVVMNENAEIAAESFPTKNAEPEQTMQHNLSSDAPAALPGDTQATAVIPLAAHAPTSRVRSGDATKVVGIPAPAQPEKPSDDTQVIALAAHAPTSQVPEETRIIPVAGPQPEPKTEEETKVIPLAAHAPSSSPKARKPRSSTKKNKTAPAAAGKKIPAADDNENTAVDAKPAADEKEAIPDPSAPNSDSTSAPETQNADPAPAPETNTPPGGDELDFPDVHGEAEKIDVFGDNDLP